MKGLALPDILSTMEAARSSYSEVDPAIERWVTKHGLALCREWQGEARFWYTSRGAECFQVAIAPPSNGVVRVSAWSIETDDDAELRGQWEVLPEDIEQGLVAATDLIDQWSLRRKMVR